MSIVRVLMERDGLNEDEAKALVNEAREALYEYINDGDLVGAEDVCEEFFGLEPDYVMELL